MQSKGGRWLGCGGVSFGVEGLGVRTSLTRGVVVSPSRKRRLQGRKDAKSAFIAVLSVDYCLFKQPDNELR